ncbi:hypothetical protein [Salinimicrobium sediminilitoris]|uniref:hypothetical protein n=1 Tax=Salinimicrobium sediminilitoris TaxID=2876715 RepID=UPI001E352043|nr:hypothetical protein [Salinimicrobium sediminilitoris]MCC8361348.1 hypothetical protein [Salinimicrobium sediminilitoris]
MKLFLSLALILTFLNCFSQNSFSESRSGSFLKDTLISIEADPAAGFSHEYLLMIPKGTTKAETIFLAVEPNNTGFTSDSIELHREGAIFVATKRSIGNIVATELHLPLLVPVFPRTRKENLVYTHALDRDAMLSQNEEIKRIDLQLLAMIRDARRRLQDLGIPVEEKVVMTGFSASGSFVNRFTFLHPEKLRAVVTGGLNGILMLPLKEMNNYTLNYPLGINDLREISGSEIDLEVYKKVPQFIFMGQLDDNDAVLYDDAYNEEERTVVYATVGEQMQPKRWETCQNIYKNEGVNAEFHTYEKVGHWSTPEINGEVIEFIKEQITEEGEE